METRTKNVFLNMEITPVAKGRPRTARMGGRVVTYTPDKTRSAEKQIAMEARIANIRPVLAPTSVFIEFGIPMPTSWSEKRRNEQLGLPVMTRPDIDNYVKLVMDALDGIAWPDDNQVYRVDAQKVYAEKGYINMRIEYLS